MCTFHTSPLAGLSVSSVSVTLAVAIAVAVAVDVQVTQCFVDAELVSLAKSVQQKTDNEDNNDEVLALPLLPLESNLQEDVDKDAAADQLLKVTENVQLIQPKEKKVTGTTATAPKLQPYCIIEVEASPEANERGHVVIAIENPNPDLDVHIVVRMRRKLKLLLLLLYLFKLQHISLLHLWLIEKRLKYKRHGLFREKRCIWKTVLKLVKTISFKWHNLFSFQKWKQTNPAKLFIKEIEMLKQTEDCKELSTSTEMEEASQEKMIRKATGRMRQDHKDVSVSCHLKSNLNQT